MVWDMAYVTVERELQGTPLSSIATRVESLKPSDLRNHGFGCQAPRW
jgi:hypothetical protein